MHSFVRVTESQVCTDNNFISGKTLRSPPFPLQNIAEIYVYFNAQIAVGAQHSITRGRQIDE